MRTVKRVRLAGVVLAMAIAAPAGATTYNVSTVAQLEAAIASVNAGPGNDKITLAPGFYLVSARLVITRDVTIEGDPLFLTVIDGGIIRNTIMVVNAQNATIRNLTLQNGGQGIDYEGSGILSVSGVTITRNFGGGFYTDGGGVINIVNSTIADNVNADVPMFGVGLQVDTGVLNLTNVTVTGNDIGIVDGDTASIRNSIIAGSLVQDCMGRGTPAARASIDGDGSCRLAVAGSGFTTAASLAALALGSLASNGGPTETEALLAGSMAINTGDNAACQVTDQRGFVRNDGACDVGAYELGASPPVAGNTPVGFNVSLSPSPGVTVVFAQVTIAGDTTATPVGLAPPTGFQFDGNVLDISTTSTYTGPVEVCFPYNPAIDPNPTIYHLESGVWVNRTDTIDPANLIVCAQVSSLSPFAVILPKTVIQQLADLQVLVDQMNLRKRVEKRFDHRLDDARKAWIKHQRRFCHELGEFMEAVRHETGRSLTPAEASQLMTLASQIAGEVGCRSGPD